MWKRFIFATIGVLVSIAIVSQPHIASAEVTAPFDTSYGVAGVNKVSIPLQRSESATKDLIAAADGSTFALIAINTEHGSPKFTIGKFTNSGSVDTTFGTNGYTAIGELSNVEFALHTQGHIIVAGYENFWGGSIVVQRYSPTGVQDLSFGTGGEFKVHNLPGKNFAGGAISLAIHPTNGSIFIGANLNNGFGSNYNFYLVSATATGQLNFGWGWAGGREIAMSTGGVSAFSQLFDIQVLSDGSLLAVGSDYDNGNQKIILLKFTEEGHFDPTFDGSTSGNGVVRQQFDSLSSSVMTTLQPLSDGTFLVAGVVGTYYYGPNYYGIAKFQSDGTIDTTFGSNGYLTSSASLPSGETFPGKITQLPSGDFVIAATLTSTSSGYLRFSSAGQFNTCSQTCVWPTPSMNVTVVVGRPDGKIAVGGFTLPGYDSFVGRISTGATIDSTFASGYFSKSFTEQDWTLTFDKSLPQADGSVLSLGRGSIGGDSWLSFPVVVKTLANGMFDTNFGVNGIRILKISNQRFSAPRDFMVTPTGKILVLADSNNADSRSEIVLWKLDANGNLDNSFGTSGMSITGENSFSLNPSSMAVAPDGKIYTSVTRTDYNSYVSWLFRFNADGSIDSSFTDSNNASGRVLINIGDGPGLGFQIHDLSNSRITVSGTSYFSAVAHTVIAQYKLDGTLETAFSSDGHIEFQQGINNTIDWIQEMKFDQNGNFVILGYSQLPTESAVMARLLPNGTFDTSFGTGGISRFRFVSTQVAYYSWENSFVITDSGILIAGSGSFDSDEVQKFSFLGRMTLTGSIDNSFHSNGYFLAMTDERSQGYHLAAIDQSRTLLTGNSFSNDETSGLLLKIGPRPTPTPVTSTTIAPTTTVATSAPVTTTTIAPVVAASSDINLVISVNQTSILKKLKMTVPQGGKVSMASMTLKVCKVVKTKVIATSAGTCRVKVTVTVKKKKSSKTLALKVS